MSIDRTVVKQSICRKKSDTRPTTAKRQNSWNQDRHRDTMTSQPSSTLEKLVRRP